MADPQNCIACYKTNLPTGVCITITNFDQTKLRDVLEEIDKQSISVKRRFLTNFNKKHGVGTSIETYDKEVYKAAACILTIGIKDGWLNDVDVEDNGFVMF